MYLDIIAEQNSVSINAVISAIMR